MYLHIDSFFPAFFILEALVDAKTTYQEPIIVLIGNKNPTFMLVYNSDGNYIVICLQEVLHQR